MSLKTWKKEFYPIPANKCSRDNAGAQSLLRWKGLRATNIKKHCVDGLGARGLYFETACSLCAIYKSCASCILSEKACAAGCRAFDYGDPEPMIAALEKALKKEKSKKPRAARRKGKK